MRHRVGASMGVRDRSAQERHHPREGTMGFLDKAKDLVTDNKDQLKDGIDKAADVVDDRTGGKHSDHIGQVADKAKDAIDKLDGA